MTAAARIEAKERGLNGQQRKVLACVPIASPWTASQIGAEMYRVNGTGPTLNVIQACLSQLCDAGLVMQVAGAYQRVQKRAHLSVAAARDDTNTETKEDGVDIDAVHAHAPPKTPLDRLANAGQTLRTLASTLLRVADEIDETALAVEEQIKGAGAEIDKLRQLRDLLNSIK